MQTTRLFTDHKAAGSCKYSLPQKFKFSRINSFLMLCCTHMRTGMDMLQSHQAPLKEDRRNRQPCFVNLKCQGTRKGSTCSGLDGFTKFTCKCEEPARRFCGAFSSTGLTNLSRGNKKYLHILTAEYAVTSRQIPIQIEQVITLDANLHRRFTCC